MFIPKILRFNTLIFVIIFLVIDEVDLDVAFVHPFQEFLIKLVTASEKGDRNLSENPPHPNTPRVLKLQCANFEKSVLD